MTWRARSHPSAYVVFFILSFLSTYPSSAQLTFAQSSLLNDSSFIEHRIRNISDEDLFGSLQLDSHDLKIVKEQTASRNFQSAYSTWGEYWESSARPKYITQNYRLLLDTDLLMDYGSMRAYGAESPAEQNTILSRAAMILQNRIRVWGDVTVEFGEKVDFNREVGQSGKYGFHYWIWSRPLNAAYVLTGDQKYLAKFDQLFQRWYEQRNNITRGFPELDVVYYELGLGIRNRMFIEHYLMPFEDRTWQTHERMLKTNLGAARWLYELEKWEGYRPGNWQSHGCYMLAQIAMVFPEFKESEQWLSIALKRIDEHMERDFFEDGGHSERSPRNYTMATYLTYRNLYYLLNVYRVHPELAAKIHATMGKTIDWWLTMITPLGETPAINDSHRSLFPAYVLRDGAEFFGKKEVFGVLKNLLGIETDMPTPLPAFTSRHMPASGFTVMRTDWTRDALYMTINYGKFAGFHTHNDMLDFEIYAYGKALAVDAGIGLTYDDPLYIPWYQSSRAHNMVVVNEQNVDRKGIEGENLVWNSSSSIDYFAGEHRGYAKLGITIQRRIAFVKPYYWVVLDRISSSKSGDMLSWYFHSPTRLSNTDNRFFSVSSPGVSILPASRSLSFRQGKGMAATTDDAVPGRTREIDWIAYDQLSVAESTQVFPLLLYPFRDARPEVQFQSISDRHYVVTVGARNDHLYFPVKQYQDAEVSTDASFLLRRKEHGEETFSIVEGTFLTYRGKEIWSSPTRASADWIPIR